MSVESRRGMCFREKGKACVKYNSRTLSLKPYQATGNHTHYFGLSDNRVSLFVLTERRSYGSAVLGVVPVILSVRRSVCYTRAL